MCYTLRDVMLKTTVCIVKSVLVKNTLVRINTWRPGLHCPRCSLSSSPLIAIAFSQSQIQYKYNMHLTVAFTALLSVVAGAVVSNASALKPVSNIHCCSTSLKALPSHFPAHFTHTTSTREPMVNECYIACGSRHVLLRNKFHWPLRHYLQP